MYYGCTWSRYVYGVRGSVVRMKHCAASQKVWSNALGSKVALESTHLSQKWVQTIFCVGNSGRLVRLTTSPPSVTPLFRKCGRLDVSLPCVSPGIALPFPLTIHACTLALEGQFEVEVALRTYSKCAEEVAKSYYDIKCDDGSQGTAVGIATDCGVVDRRIGVRVLVEARFFFSRRRLGRLTVGHSVCLGVKPDLGPQTRLLLLSNSCKFINFGQPLWPEGGPVVCNCCWYSPAQSYLPLSKSSSIFTTLHVVIRVCLVCMYAV
jgi:hypothetical protein